MLLALVFVSAFRTVEKEMQGAQKAEGDLADEVYEYVADSLEMSRCIGNGPAAFYFVTCEDCFPGPVDGPLRRMKPEGLSGHRKSEMRE